MKVDTLIRSLWVRMPPFGVVRAVANMMHDGNLPQPVDLTPGQRQLWNTTHMYMCAAAAEVQTAVKPYKLDVEVWRWLLRGGVCWRVLATPGESDHIRMLNAMRGERRKYGERKATPLHEQLAYPAGHADAMLALLRVLLTEQPDGYYELGLSRYHDVLVDVGPKLRRTTKATQEPKAATCACEVNCAC